MRRHTVLIAACVLLCAGHAFPQFIYTTTQGLGGVPGTGARAIGMGGAFIAVADDATAASWNPAGLAQLEQPEVSFTLDWFEGDRTFQSAWVGEWDIVSGSVEKRDHHYYSALRSDDLAFLSGTYPFQIGEIHTVAQFTYRRMVSFPSVDRTLGIVSAEYDSDDVEVPHTYDSVTTVERADFSGGVDSYGLSLAAQVASCLRVGLTAGYVDGSGRAYLTSQERLFVMPADPRVVNTESSYDFSALQLDVGVQWTPIEAVTVGAVYHSGFSTGFDYRERVDLDCDPEAWGPSCNRPSEVYSEGDVRWPEGWGLGVAWRPSSKLVVSADYGEYEWSKGGLKGISRAGWDDLGNPIAVGQPDGPYPYYAEQNDTYSFRLGVEYQLSYLSAGIPVRAGVFREKLPLISSDYTRNDSPPEGPVNDGVALGIGLIYGSFQIDIAWMHSVGDADYPVTVIEDDEIFDVAQNSRFAGDHFLASFTYRF